MRYDAYIGHSTHNFMPPPSGGIFTMPKNKPHRPSTTAALVAYNKARAADWGSVDWIQDNATIAALIGRSYNTVAKKRVELGKTGLAPRRARIFAKSYYPNLARKDGKGQKAAVAAAKSSPIAGKAETNCHAKHWRIISPAGEQYEFTNLYHFIRSHTRLFAAADTEWKRQGGKRGTGGEYCNAANGLQYAARTGKQWKGWDAEIISAPSTQID